VKNVLIVGLGNMSLNHISLLRKGDFNLYGADPALGSQIIVREVYGVTNTADCHKDICLKHTIDLAIICSPPSTHYMIAVDLISLGVPTYIEKPGFDSVEQFDEIQTLAVEHNCPFRIGTQLPYNQEIASRLKRIVAGAYGELRYIEYEDHAPYFGSAKSGGANQSTVGAFLKDMLPHPLSMIVAVSQDLVGHSIQPIKDADGTLVGAIFLLQLNHNVDCTVRLDFGSAQTKNSVCYNFAERNLRYDFRLLSWLSENYSSGNPIFTRMFPNIAVGSKKIICGVINPVKLLLNLSNPYDAASAFAQSLMNTSLSEQLATGELANHRKVIDYQGRCMAQLKPFIIEEPQSRAYHLPKRVSVIPDIIIAGSNGFIGLSLLRECIKQNRHVFALTRTTNAELELLAQSEWVTLLKVRTYNDLMMLDIELKAGIPFINLAAPVSGGYSKQANETVDIMNAVIGFSLKYQLLLYHVGSITTYATSKFMLPNRQDEMKKEPEPYAKGAYTFAKHLAERYLAEAAAEKGLKYNILHPGIVWSDAKADAVLVKLGSVMAFDLYAGSGSRRVPVIQVGELASRMIAISSERPLFGQEHLLISNRTYTNRSFYRQQLKCEGRHALFIPRTLLFVVGVIIDKIRGRSSTYPKIGVQLSGFSASWPKQ